MDNRSNLKFSQLNQTIIQGMSSIQMILKKTKENQSQENLEESNQSKI